MPNRWPSRLLDKSSILRFRSHIALYRAFAPTFSSSNLYLNGRGDASGANPPLQNDARIVIDVAVCS
jgi:hypothetical protein